MIITACYEPAPTATKTEQVEQCHTFSDLEHFQQWLKERGIQMGKLPCTAWKP